MLQRLQLLQASTFEYFASLRVLKMVSKWYSSCLSLVLSDGLNFIEPTFLKPRKPTSSLNFLMLIHVQHLGRTRSRPDRFAQRMQTSSAL